jgi:glycosyltransferase involved in cell wall biosynthesis
VDSPKVTVLMPVYNGEKYLEEAVESILGQTFRDFEFIIIDGGSTDGTPAILARYQQTNNRIRVYYQENQKLVASLNMGCQLARGEYIARMDADDLSLPERLAKRAPREAWSVVKGEGLALGWFDNQAQRVIYCRHQRR